MTAAFRTGLHRGGTLPCRWLNIGAGRRSLAISDRDWQSSGHGIPMQAPRPVITNGFPDLVDEVLQ